MDILLRRDDKMLPSFCEALKENQQPHIVDILRRNGLSYEYNILHHMHSVAWRILDITVTIVLVFIIIIIINKLINVAFSPKTSRTP